MAAVHSQPVAKAQRLPLVRVLARDRHRVRRRRHLHTRAPAAEARRLERLRLHPRLTQDRKVVRVAHPQLAPAALRLRPLLAPHATRASVVRALLAAQRRAAKLLQVRVPLRAHARVARRSRVGITGGMRTSGCNFLSSTCCCARRATQRLAAALPQQTPTRSRCNASATWRTRCLHYNAR